MDDVFERFPVAGTLGWLRRAFADKLQAAGFGRAEG
jgi:hypothetical protein